ncbi:hypothetical protein NCU10883 [Neurospora crassa OR74A]|uniref:Uncharacterized protein n=1 Tax=Neurospora crassa (strain ATCC 24698 / 74-OR23-1A / CBS 708.71 / DSM 1257 / FGSC 987) TaxID=367110 RepID=V5INF2_NEUCR|nr:hypothetical protein NCU10883 [Neurospora crassa OR74A]ESA42301.1 hypothetical protein NCU10883 [Neurospora crassa OR74A]|eukprot:XP_011395028.1 hypothetical protein NCU10883 [Neurospora crassa OR74A]
MADPLSIAGLVTGVVSLGIQLHNDLKIFLDIVKNRDEDIAKLTRQAATMAQALDAIDRSLQNSSQAKTGVVDSAAIIPLLDASRQELLLLQQEVASLTKTSKGQNPKASVVVDFAKATTQKLKYPRQRAKIEKLEEGLDQANTTLQLALDAFGLSELSSIKSNTEAMVHGLSHVQKTLPDVEACVSKLSEKLMATSQTATQSIQNIEAILNLAISSHQSDLEQFGQAQSNEFSQIKQLIQDLSLRMDANASTGSKDIEVNRNLACLVSKPSALKVLCDEYSNQQPQSECPSDANAWSVCACQSRRIATRRSVDWGPFRLSAESKAELAHHESCQWAQFDASKRSKAISLAYRGFTRLLRHAVVLNFRLNLGAGGFSFGPGVVHYPVVDERVYPPFRLVHYVVRAMKTLTEPLFEPFSSRQRRTSQGKIILLSVKHSVLKAFSVHISRACCDRTIVPRAVNTRGQTLLHCISRIIENYACGRVIMTLQGSWTQGSWTPSMVASVHEVLSTLIMCNVPLTVHDDLGSLAHLTIANCIRTTDENLLASMTSILRLLTPEDMDIDPSKAKDWPNLFGPPLDFLITLPDPYIFSKAFGSNELGTAILQHNISAVKSLLSRSPSLAFERDLNGMTPIHHAVLWKDGLSLLLEQVPVEIFEEDLAWDIFQYALCVGGRNDEYLRSVMLFLDHSWYFAPCSSQGRGDGTIGVIMKKSSLATQKKFLLHLKQARLELVPHSLQSETVHGIIDHLQEIAATLPPGTRRARLQAGVDSFDIFRYIRNAETADAAWQSGFHEVDYHPATEFPPLADGGHTADYVLWLLDHDADPFQPLYDTQDQKASILTAHKAIGCIHSPIGAWSDDIDDWELKVLGPAAQEVARRLCSKPATDSCLCACSPNGCTPFLILLTTLIRGSPYILRFTSSRAEDYALEFWNVRTILYENDGFVCQYDEQFQEALRLFTCTALGIRHTCCKMACRHSDDDAKEIREEDSELVGILETLMEQWEDVRFKSTDEFWRFLEGGWVIRLNEVFEGMRQMDQSEEHKVQLESLGVQLHVPIAEAKSTKPRVRTKGFIWLEESFWLDLLDTVAKGGDTRYFDRVLEDATLLERGFALPGRYFYEEEEW